MLKASNIGPWVFILLLGTVLWIMHSMQPKPHFSYFIGFVATRPDGQVCGNMEREQDHLITLTDITQLGHEMEQRDHYSQFVVTGIYLLKSK